MLIKRRLSEGDAMISKGTVSAHEADGWEHSAEQALKDTFGSDHAHVTYFWQQSPPETIGSVSSDPWDGAEVAGSGSDFYQEKVEVKTAALRAILKHVEERLALKPDVTAQPAVTRQLGEEIFVVHGHNDAIKEATARLVEQLGLKPTILHEQANKGRTIIEKFESHAGNAGFAVILLTADDVGRKKLDQVSSELPRARQNVILELGFFLGALGRSRVCALYEKGVELPSDFLGVAFIEIDERGKWKNDLGFELRAAGYDISLDKIR